jgi:twinkle protein
MGGVIGREQCPKCAEGGGDRSKNNLARYSDGGGHCFVCNYHEFANSKNRVREEKVATEKVGIEVYHSLPYGEVHGVSKETCQKYGIKVSVNEETGRVESVYYPYYSEDGKLVAAKVRKLATKEFHWIGSPSKATLFGQQTIGQGGQMVIITEGEKDALALSEMYRLSGKNYRVVSIKDGASLPRAGEKLPKPDITVATNLDLLSKFNHVIVAMDKDKAGEATANMIAEMVAPVTSVKILDYPDGYKDAHECFEGVFDSSGEQLKPAIPRAALTWLQNARDFVPEAIYNGSDIALEDLMTPLAPGAPIPFQGLQEKMHGLRKGELTTICAASGAGKSTLTRELAYSLVKSGHRVANIFLEETMEKTAQSFIALDNNIPLARLRAMPNSIAPDDYKRSYEELVANGRNFFFKHFGSLDSDLLLNKMRYFAQAQQCDFIFLDHLSMVVSASDEGNDERKLLDKICTKLAAFCTETGVGVIMVVHLRKTGNNQQSASQGGMITLDDLRGSGGIAQLSFNVVAALRDTTAVDDGKANIVQLWVLKNREWGSTGMAGRLVYDRQTGRLKELPDF